MRLRDRLSTFLKSKYTRVATIISIELVAILCLTVYQYFKYLPAPDINLNTSITFYDAEGEIFLQKTYPKDQHWVKFR